MGVNDHLKAKPSKGETLPLTRKMLMDWAGAQIFHDAKAIVNKGLVEDAVYEPPFISGSIHWANRSLRTKLKILDDGAAENACPCRDSIDRGIICSHVIAIGLHLVACNTDPDRNARHREERRRAERLARYDDNDYIQRTADDDDDRAVSARLRLTLCGDWQAAQRNGGTLIRCEAEFHSYREGLGKMPRDQIFAFSKKDEAVLYVLEDISEGPARSELQVNASDFVNLLRLMRGGDFFSDQDEPLHVNDIAVSSRIQMDLDNENGELILILETDLPYQRAGEFPHYVVDARSGWAFGADHFWPLEALLPDPLRQIYSEPVIIPRASVPAFVQHELPVLESHIPIRSEITPDLFVMEPGDPVFRLHLRGSPASCALTLYADYPGVSIVAARDEPASRFAVPDPDDIMSYTVRNPEAEEEALCTLRDIGIQGSRGDELSAVVGVREVLNHLGGHLPRLRRLGWKIELEGKIEPYMDSADFITPVVRIDSGSGMDWFEVDFDFECGDHSLNEADIQRALLKGDSYVERNGRTILFDSDAITSLREVFSDICGTDADTSARMRIDALHAAFINSSLDALDGVDVESDARWRTSARQFNRKSDIEPVDLDPELEDTLRPYQKEGVQWLRFLEHNNFCGLLADEMGLGKTLQTLTWMQLERLHQDARGKPSLVICPTSLVENWAAEAHRFVPNLNVLLMTGSDRKNRWDDVPNADMVVTSYALMRRDVERYLEIEFAAIVLDEAQHIKNRSTRNAVAAKQLRAHHRVVLTGTPIENSVADLWSIMDFLMPGYLGRHDAFRQDYELPIAQRHAAGEIAQTKLRRKLHPFLMRRMKTDVAKDLPPKIERVLPCTLTDDQKMVYKQYLDAARRKLTDLVTQKGFARSRMEILKVLLRLRQVCCHLDLLKLPDLDSKYPSAKMDVFFELVDEALDGGHRILVFSQFTSMLRIIQREIEERGLSHCYLDGATKNRMATVREFNTNRDIPLFLISLKAGGTGLNLTGADMVIHFDPWWNPAVEDQATDRAHRIGQKNTVYSIKLITRDTVEEKVLALQKRKREVINATVEASNDPARSLTWDDVQNLLTL